MNMIRQNFLKGRFIAHAGGSIEEMKYTNSREAFLNSARSVQLIELDVCNAADGLIIAHDGLEKSYGLSKPFIEGSLSDFRLRRYSGRFGAMTLSDLCEAMQGVHSSVILDIKSSSIDVFSRNIDELYRTADSYGVLGRMIPQVYSIDDFNVVAGFGIKNFILALWKNFPNVRTQHCANTMTTVSLVTAMVLGRFQLPCSICGRTATL